MTNGKEAARIREAYADDSANRWLLWGPYLSERQWGTVREDYSEGGNAWSYFPHDHARSRAYRWGEDGLAGISDDEQRICFALGLWNGRDPIVKERLFGLTNDEGNHGEDVKEYYYYLDNTPTHSYMKWLYKYPQQAFPYDALVAENLRRKQTDSSAPEYELMDTGIFSENRYFDIQVEYAKAAPQDILIKIRVTNRGPESADLRLLPTLWFRNTWTWFKGSNKPTLKGQGPTGPQRIATLEASASPGALNDAGPMVLYCLGPDRLLFVENESNAQRLWGLENSSPYPKDGINDHLIAGTETVNPALEGTKASADYRLQVGPGDTSEVRLRLSSDPGLRDPFGSDFDASFQARIAEADAFYTDLGPEALSEDERAIQRQAYAGMLWSKQYYHYIVKDWLEGDSAQPPPPKGRTRNLGWTHFYASHVLSMPDAWEYPWFAAWDLCFQSVVFARIDPHFAKEQLLILAREWYMSPAGAVPAYEWAFDDVNPPLHAWAALRIFEIEREMHGGDGDINFLESVFRYCLTYFAWWTNRKDADNKNLFEGGFLGLDNISLIDRSHLSALEAEIGRGLHLWQSDGTSWMGMFSLNLMEMALKLSMHGQSEYAHLANKFFQHFVFIADAMNSIERFSGGDVRLWDEEDGFYYDVLKITGGGAPDEYLSLRLRSLIGIIALFPVMTLDMKELEEVMAGKLKARVEWFVAQHPQLLDQCLARHTKADDRHLLTFVKPVRLKRILERVLDESEFLSPHGIRSISRSHLDPPYAVAVGGAYRSVRYEPAESSVGIFGGNSNWRGPIWFPINFLLIEALKRYHAFLGDDFKVEHPTGSGDQRTLREVADDLSRRLVSIFTKDSRGRRPVHGDNPTFQQDPYWRDLLLFYEYFHGDKGAGIGASHQTGWTGLVAELIRNPS